MSIPLDNVTSVFSPGLQRLVSNVALKIALVPFCSFPSTNTMYTLGVVPVDAIVTLIQAMFTQRSVTVTPGWSNVTAELPAITADDVRPTIWMLGLSEAW